MAIFNTCFWVHNDPLNLYMQAENSKWILCSQKTGVKYGHLRVFVYTYIFFIYLYKFFRPVKGDSIILNVKSEGGRGQRRASKRMCLEGW